MNHLTPRELVEAVEGSLPAARRQHLDACGGCARAWHELAGAVLAVKGTADVPEPSPLFWDHFSARVRDAVAAEPVSPRGAWWAAAWRPVTAAVLLAAALFLVIGPPGRSTAPESVPPPEVVAASEAPEPARAPAAPSGDAQPAAAEPARGDTAAEPREQWAGAAEIGRRLDRDGVHTLVPTAPSTVVLVEELNDRELQEFARLLRAEMGGIQ
jgi:hypothetical protein